MAKYARALAISNDLEFDPHMSFLKSYAEKNVTSSSKKFLISRSKSNFNNHLEFVDRDVPSDIEV